MVPLTLAGLCRLAPLPDPVLRGGQLWWAFFGLRGKGATVEVGIDPEDTEAIAALSRARSDPRSMVELFAFLAVALELDGLDGAWRTERVTELLHGVRDRQRGHRDRQGAGVLAWLSLLSRATFVIDAPVSRGALGGSVTGTLLSLEAIGPRTSTIRLHQGLAECLRAGVGAKVPAGTFDLRTPKDWKNTGTKPPVAVLARVRVAAAICAKFHWRSKGARDKHHAQAVTVEELVAKWAGIDAEKITRQKRWSSWTDAIVAELEAMAVFGGVGVDTPIERARPHRKTLLPLAHPWNLGVRTRAFGGLDTRQGGRLGGPDTRRALPVQPSESSSEDSDATTEDRLEAPSSSSGLVA